MSDQPPVFGISLVVRDVDASVAFYRTLGVHITDEMNWKSQHVGVPTGGGGHFDIDSVELTKSYDPGWEGTAPIVILRVPSRGDVDVAYERVTAAGHDGHLAPFDAFWGARYAVVRDPDGNHVGIMSPQEE